VLLGAHFGLHGYTALTFLQRLGYIGAVLTSEGVAHDEASWFYRHLVLPTRYRCHAHISVITRTGSPPRAIVECLRRNQILMVMGDVFDNHVVKLPAPNVLPAPLLGRSVPLNTGPFRLARWVGAPVLPFFLAPRESGFAMVIERALRLSEDDSAKGLAEDLAAFTARLERYVRQYPSLWFGARNSDLAGLMLQQDVDLGNGPVLTNALERHACAPAE
jgi:predicted LPLAT superfamily acyltransferase